MENRKAVIVGAGVSGLCAAVELKRRGFDVLVLERQARAGGVVNTLEKDGFRAESGSNSVMVQSQKTLDFLAEMGLSDKIDYANPVSKKRFFVRYGKPRAVPMGPFGLLFTRLFTFCGKIRLFCEPFVKKFPADAEPSVSEFVRRRMGNDVLDYAINPFMAGVYGGNPDRLSIRHAFAPFWNLEQKYGSIIRGAIKSMKAKKAAGNFFKPVMISFENGMKTFIDALEAELGGALRKNVKTLSLDFAPDGWEVSWGSDDEEGCDRFNVAVIAVPAPEIRNLPLPGSLSEPLKILDGIKYAAVSTLTTGFRREQIGHKLDGFGVLTPEREKLSILGSLFVSSVFKNRAPDGCVALTNYIGGMRRPDLAAAEEDEQLKLVLADLAKLLRVRGEPVFTAAFHWKYAIPQYEIGYQKYLDALDELESRFENISFIGSYRGGVGVSSCIENALSAADRLSKKN